ncbi:hypothetical protein LTR28_003249 [Elasticomyces elasticus]|nr:hypothetical protein LTR28_003249 [Elasticomyces elasticus]
MSQPATTPTDSPLTSQQAVTPTNSVTKLLRTTATSDSSVKSPGESQTSMNLTTTASSSAGETTSISSSSSSSSDPVTYSSNSSTISTGVLAGAIVASFVGSAVLAFVIAYLCLRSRVVGTTSADKRRRSGHRSHTSRRTSEYAPAAGFNEKDAAVDTSHAWEKYLPSSLDDRTVGLKVKGLYDQIQLHVENFYVNTPRPIIQVIAASIKKMHTPYLEPLACSMSDSSLAPQPIIKHCLAYMITQGLSSEAAPEVCLVPRELAAVLRTRQIPADMSHNPQATRQILSKWRVLTAHLRPGSIADPEHANELHETISMMVDRFSTTFLPFESKKGNIGAGRQHLTELLRSAAEVAYMLFSQPSTFEFRWKQASVKKGTAKAAVVVVPKFTKTADEDGNELEQAQTLVSMVLESL